MARPIKQGLDYFPMDVTTDDKFELIEAKHGIVGFGIIIKLFQRIYKEGYYLKWTEEIALIFKKKINVDINLVNDVINDAIAYNIFDKSCFNKFKILTSSGIQKRYLTACERRKGVELTKKYIIVDKNSINAYKNSINVDKKYTKESKVKESKINKTTANFSNDYNEPELTPEQVLNSISKRY